MKREWKPGDVALVRCDASEWHVAIRVETSQDGDQWYCTSGSGEAAMHVTEARPVVVIDAEDDEQVERLHQEFRATAGVNRAFALQGALRWFADQPPRIAEPGGLGAVVELTSGEVLVRTEGNGDTANWADKYGDFHYWSDIAAVRVLSEGVQ